MMRQSDPMDFAKIASELGFQGLEYLQMSYTGGLLREKKEISLNKMKNLALNLNKKADEYGMENVLIMIDIGPDLGSINDNLDDYHPWICLLYTSPSPRD